ncbi:TPA_asm: DDE-type integrase/transposase/recombinase [Listeria monocytogenes]|nr:DDE-type integrase/transposase/recombinase [Listeria monocytogenes]HAC0982457.1 DDE-type integrase/transposase/recombinase [Listeria monocytogenes]
MRDANPNLLKQEFHAEKPNQIWFGDISYIPTQKGMLYCSVFIDCYSRKCVGFAIRTHLRDSLVIESLEAAIHQEKPNNGLIHSYGSRLPVHWSSFLCMCDAVSLHSQSIP